MGAAKHWIPVGLAALLCAALPQQAEAGGRHRGHGHGHGHSHGRYWFGFGYPYYWGPPAVVLAPRYYAPYPPYYAAPYPVYAPPRVMVQEPPVYIERGSESSGSWYYCESAGEYYPEVETCDEPWIRVPARD
jgi:hypothetical protein